MLLDDGGTAGLDKMLPALALHPQIEVRLFNPFVVRKPKFLGYITDFNRYWASPSAYPAQSILPAMDEVHLHELSIDTARIAESDSAHAYT